MDLEKGRNYIGLASCLLGITLIPANAAVAVQPLTMSAWFGKGISSLDKLSAVLCCSFAGILSWI